MFEPLETGQKMKGGRKEKGMDVLEALEKEEDDLRAILKDLINMKSVMVPLNDQKIWKLAHEHATLIALGEVEAAHQKSERIERVKNATSQIMEHIGRVEKRLKEIEEMNLKP